MAFDALVMDYSGVLTDGPGLLELVRRVRSTGTPTALVTDADTVPDACAAAFDLVVLGSMPGARKPDPDLYRLVAARLGVPVAGCVVVDDHVRNVRGARAAGAVVVHHQDEATTVDELSVLFDVPAGQGGPTPALPGRGHLVVVSGQVSVAAVGVVVLGSSAVVH
ncbi:HAD-IA family hydrolase [Pseudonocardia adelaidensis]|uniref:HAD superfamily hydrolase (TIGR01509 family) n=1 Tax=Pseudonocardia adelaidensis TaxID=648754 RepID=A0ABP9NAN1_9PSEU